MRAKFATAALIALMLTAAAPAPVMTAPDLVAKNLAARGGAEKLAALKGVRLDGKLVYPGDFQLTYQETRERIGGGTSIRVDAAVQGLTVVQAWDGSVGWKINPFEGRKDAERMSGDDARALADQGLLDGPLQSAKRDGSAVSYLGREDFDGTEAYKLRVVQKDGDEFVYMLDPDTFLEIKMVETRRLRGAQQVTEYELGDYERVGGVYFPMSVDSWSQGQPNQRQRVIIASAIADPVVTPALFVQPTGSGGATATPANTGKPTDTAQTKDR